MRHSTQRWLAGAALALAVLGGAIALSVSAQPVPPPATPTGSGNVAEQGGLSPPRSDATVQRQGDLLRYTHRVTGDAKPISIDADEIHTWQEGGLTALLLNGQVLVQQGVTQTRFEKGVVWVDLMRFKSTGVLHLDLYAEGQVRLDHTLDGEEAKRAVLELETRGEFRVRAHKGKVVHQQQADAIVDRGRAAGAGPKLIQAGASEPRASPSTVQPATPARQTLPPASPAPQPQTQPAPAPQSGAGVRPVSLSRPVPTGRDGPPAEEIVLMGGPQPAADTGEPGRLPVGAMPTQNTLPDEAAPSRDEPEAPGGATPILTQVEPPEGARVAPLPPPSEPAGPLLPPPMPPNAPPRQYRVLPRNGEKFQFTREVQPDGSQVLIFTGGIILQVQNVPKLGNLDVEADRAVIWTKGGDKDKSLDKLRSQEGTNSSELEFYMAGHVTVRVQDPRGKQKSVLETEEIYYDTNRNVAVALNARLRIQVNKVFMTGGTMEPLVLIAREIRQTDENHFEMFNAEIWSSKLITDPGLKLIVSEATVENRTRPKKNILNWEVIDRKTGKPMQVEESILVAKDVIGEFEGVPYFYTPYLVTDARDPLGPLQTINFGESRIFGAQLGVGLNVYKLLGLQPLDGTRWRMYLDYLSRRGPAMGTTFTYQGKLYKDADVFEPDAKTGWYSGAARLYGINDAGTDILAGQPLQNEFRPTALRGRAYWQQIVTDLPGGFNVASQVSMLSDRNFLEEYYKQEYDRAQNQSNFVDVKYQEDNLALTLLGQARTSAWITTTEWLPRADAYLLGQDFWGMFTSNTQASIGWAHLKPSSDPDPGIHGIPGPAIPAYPFIQPTTQNNQGGRAFVFEELSLPFSLGPVKLVPYVKGALIDYTNDLNGNETGRAWGGAGLRASIPFSHLYPDVCSELFNVNGGINHKIVVSGNYFIARANSPYSSLPEYDRLHDDATDQGMRDFRPFEPVFNPVAGVNLVTSKLYDPQMYAIRRLIDNRIDTLDDIQVAQFDVRQRLQTKRGFPGSEHIIDWMVLDTSFSYFPEANRDNFGKPFGFLEYTYLWNIGDQTSFESTGWYDPETQGPRVFTAGVYYSRPDRTNFYIGYRQIEPLQSRLVTGSVGYVFSQKYSTAFSASYDFGVHESVTNSLTFTRTGSDLQVTLGFTYNTLQNNFGMIVEIVPNLVPIGRRGGNLMANGSGGGLTSR